MKTKIVLLASILLLFSAIFFGLAVDQDRAHKYDEYIKIGEIVLLAETDQPLQTSPTLAPFRVERNNWQATITPVADYDIRGIALGLTKYHDGENALFCPYDLAIAFGPMIREDHRAPLQFSQADRRTLYVYHDQLPYSKSIIDYNVSNNHLMPINEAVAHGISTIKKGDKVRAIGCLINIHAEMKDGRYYNWNTSTTRTDTMDGACEILYVKTLQVNDKIFSSENPTRK